MLLASDQALIERVVTTDCHDSFGILVERHQSDLRYSLRQMTGWNEALADDLAQETFIQAFKSLKNYQGTAKFSSWIYRIAYNQMVSHFRLARNREVSASEEILKSHSQQIALINDLGARSSPRLGLFHEGVTNETANGRSFTFTSRTNAL